jgi:hypothetical protein
MKIRLLAALALAILLTPVARASVLFDVSLDTSSLAGNANGPFYVDLQLNDGSGNGDANNAATVSNFSFGGGAVQGATTLIGGASGDMSGTVTLVDSGFFNLFAQAVNPGGLLSFEVLLTANTDAGLSPDEFSFSLLDGSGIPIPTASLQSALVVVDIDSANPAIQGFAALDPYGAIGAPIIRAGGPSSVAEPGSCALLACGLLLLGAIQRRCKARAPTSTAESATRC